MPEIFGRYELLKRIAGGGMGEVFLARQSGMEGFEKFLVVKTLLPNLAEDEEFVAMFLDEARLAARLNHPNVCQIYDLGEVNNVLYMAMEFIQGEDLLRISRAAAKQQREFPIPLLCRAIADAAAGLHHAHQLTGSDGKLLGIIHRDVSPQNILITFEGGVKIIDFGIAKAAGRATNTQAGVLKGKFAYMSPEQASGKEIDHRTDVFALGVVFHELLTMRRLFKAADDMQTLAAVARCEVPLPSSVNPKVPPEMDAIALQSLARDPGDRYADAQALRLALEDWLSHARQPSSTAHLAAFMHQLYKERLQKEKTQGLLWDAPKEGPISRLAGAPAPSTPTPITLPGVGDAVGTLSTQTADLAQEALTEGQRSRTRLWAIAAAVFLVVLASVAAAVRWRGQRAEAEAQRETESRLAQVTIETFPPAEIAIDGRMMGTSPLRGIELVAGVRFRIEATAEGHERYETHEVFKSGPQALSYTLKKARLTIVIASDPPGAKVQRGGLDLGVTPYAWNVERDPSPVELTLVREGYKPAKVSVTPLENGTTTVPLERLGTKPGRPAAAAQPEAPAIMEGR